MRGRNILSLAVAAMFVVASAGVLHAGGYMHRSSEPEKMSSGPSFEPGSWEYQEALETGNLPASESGRESVVERFRGEEIPTIEVGGFTYRLGVDTQ